ncbi:hypothetical protein K491DRAFT_42546 [Lophiostoma macrostomum CBS 122681]|uniref:Uncharacterized protein n=1 Tax=Lophiostoma macrostomum CBS 122681 TaxID=1314788 RepID=A0A6A6T0B3_9PLEO|nr:hypothetical protein K491DRAFT_42546 [Lophiostoma macrostomum CBS 122681]
MLHDKPSYHAYSIHLRLLYATLRILLRNSTSTTSTNIARYLSTSGQVSAPRTIPLADNLLGSAIYFLHMGPRACPSDMTFATSHWASDTSLVPNDANDTALKAACLELSISEAFPVTNKYLRAKKTGYGDHRDFNGLTSNFYSGVAYHIIILKFPDEKDWPVFREGVAATDMNLSLLGKHEFERRRKGLPPLWADKQVPRWRIKSWDKNVLKTPRWYVRVTNPPRAYVSVVGFVALDGWDGFEM